MREVFNTDTRNGNEGGEKERIAFTERNRGLNETQTTTLLLHQTHADFRPSQIRYSTLNTKSRPRPKVKVHENSGNAKDTQKIDISCER